MKHCLLTPRAITFVLSVVLFTVVADKPAGAQNAGPLHAITWSEPPAEANNMTRFVRFGNFPTEQDGRDKAQELMQRPEGLRAIFTQNFSRHFFDHSWNDTGPNPNDRTIATVLTENISDEARNSISVEPLPYDLENGHTIRIQTGDPTNVPLGDDDIIVAYVDGGANEGATTIPIRDTKWTSGGPVTITAASGDRVLSDYHSIWVYHGIAEVKESMEAFAFGIYDEGATVDWIPFDTEAGFGANIGIKHDPRWTDPEHGRDGQSFADILAPVTIDEVLNASGGNTPPRLAWSAFVSNRVSVDGLTEAFFDPVKTYFPNLKGSDYERTGLTKETADQWAINRDGWRQYKPDVFGTHGSKPLYASIRLLDNRRLPGTSSAYGRSPFSVVRWQVNFKRGMYRDTGGKSQPWLTYPNLSDGFFFRVDPKDTPYWAEHIYHMALSTDDAPLLYWNARDGGGGGADDAQDLEINGFLQDVYDQLGGNQFSLTSTEPIAWDDTVVATAVEVGGLHHYRVTVQRIDWEDTRNITVEVSNGDTITIPGGEVGAWYVNSDPELSFTYEHPPVENLFPDDTFLDIANNGWNIVSGEVEISDGHEDPLGTNKAIRVDYQGSGVELISNTTFHAPHRNQFGNVRDRWYTFSFWTKRLGNNFSISIRDEDGIDTIVSNAIVTEHTSGQWGRVRMQFIMPTDTEQATLRLRGQHATFDIAFPMLAAGWGYLPPYVAPDEAVGTSQVLDLDEGWNLVSTAVMPEEPSLHVMLSSVLDQITVVKDEDGQLFFPELGIDEIGTWDSMQAYYIFSSAATSFTVEGEPVDPSTPVPVQEGWNLVPFHGLSEVPITEALHGLEHQLIMAGDGTGQVFYPSSGVETLSTAVPGRGYKVFVEEDGTLMLAREVPQP